MYISSEIQLGLLLFLFQYAVKSFKGGVFYRLSRLYHKTFSIFTISLWCFLLILYGIQLITQQKRLVRYSRLPVDQKMIPLEM